ncbi:cytochrome P450 [Mariannaea sp. PMI_226]|nr:cytochrome P450 [Mariannaea sp. PMI_226]
MLLVILPYVLSLATLSLLVFPVIRYWWDPNGLRKFPSPSIAGFSSFWRVWHNLHYKHYAAVDDAHKRLGTHVRIAPNHLSILDPRAPNDVYGHGANMLKEAWYDAGAGAHRNLADTRVKAEHQAKRKMFAHAFAAKTVLKLEPVLIETLHLFMKGMDKHAADGTVVDMRLMLNYFTIDLFGNLLYGHNLGCLERENDLLDAESPEDGRIYKVPFVQSLLDVTVINTLLAFSPKLFPITKPLFNNHPYKRKGADWENIIYHNTKERMASRAPCDDLFTKLLQDSKGKELNLSLGEIMAECSVMMNAGTETTTAAMTSTVYLLYTHPHVLSKLRAEIDAAIPGPQVPSYDAASKLPYLRACIEESLRVRPASSFGLPRVVPEGGRHIAGQFVPEGVTVSVPTYSLLRDESVFNRATEYDPDRWMTDDPEEKRKMMANHLPFSTGPRACIGRNIAYFEQIVVIATLAKFYDCIVPVGFELETQERFNSNPGPLVVEVVPRRN